MRPRIMEILGGLLLKVRFDEISILVFLERNGCVYRIDIEWAVNMRKCAGSAAACGFVFDRDRYFIGIDQKQNDVVSICESR